MGGRDQKALISFSPALPPQLTVLALRFPACEGPRETQAGMSSRPEALVVSVMRVTAVLTPSQCPPKQKDTTKPF